MTSELIISVSGLRGIVGESLTQEVARRYVGAFLAEAPPGPIVVTFDGRTHGPMIAKVVSSMIADCGRECIYGGVAATPTTGVLVRDQQAAGGIQISASHNPAEYNGIKLFAASGRVIPAPAGQKVLDRYRSAASSEPSLAMKRATFVDTDTDDIDISGVEFHENLVMAICNADRIRARRFRVVLDANHGSGGILGKILLNNLGCEVKDISGGLDGRFGHPPEPTEANLYDTIEFAKLSDADVTFCQDPDADRLAIIDERGRYIGEEKTPALCVEHVLSTGRLGPVVTNCSTSRMSEDIARKYGVPFYRSKVGEANVVDLMLEKDAVIGGEGNGGVIDPRVGLVRDSFVGMALVLDAMAARGLPVSQLADELPHYAIHKTTIAVAADEIPAALDALERYFGDATADRLDGLRLDWPNGAWLLVRPSNTEPIVRAIAEAPTIEEAKAICEQAASAIRQ
jgi:phosphomannomutase